MDAWSSRVFWGVVTVCVWVTGCVGRPAHTQWYCDQCECYLSEDETQPKGITRVRAKCKEGHIDWSNPYGAIRMEINPGYPVDFKGCVLITTKHTTVKVSQETRSGLKHLQTVTDVSSEMCLTASSAPIMLYIELVPESNREFTGVPSVVIDYDIERQHSSQLFFDPLEDCRPCDEEELLRAYCSSDYVVEGKILRVDHRVEQGETDIEVSAHRVVQQSREGLFRSKRDADGKDHLQATIIAPTKCGVEHGPGLFLLMGSVKLGRMRLRCAPFLEDWHRVKQAAEDDDMIQCSF